MVWYGNVLFDIIEYILKFSYHSDLDSFISAAVVYTLFTTFILNII